MTVDLKAIQKIPDLTRIETIPIMKMKELATDMTHAVYPHDELFNDFCGVQSYINCPPDKVFDYLKELYSLEEWTYSLREFSPSEVEGVSVGLDLIVDNTKIYCKVKSNKEALTVDYHCAWDQGEELWMIYLNRIVPAELVLKKPGSVVFWQNCHHPNYKDNPYPDRAPKSRPWIGDFWNMFYAGHKVELTNLKRILEHRHSNNLPIGPFVK